MVALSCCSSSLAPAAPELVVLELGGGDLGHRHQRAQHGAVVTLAPTLDDRVRLHVLKRKVVEHLALDRLGARARVQQRVGHRAREQQRVELRVVLDVVLLLAALELVERRLRDVDVAPLDELGHLAVEERQQQRADVRAVDVRVRHDDDAVIAQVRDIELVAADAAAERRDQRADLVRL